MGDAIFKVPTPAKLTQIVDALDGIYGLMNQGEMDDTKGDVYEYLLSKISTSGTSGQFRTSRHIIRMMVELMAPKPGEIICDPACGTAGFLVLAGEYLRERYVEEHLINSCKKTLKENYDLKIIKPETAGLALKRQIHSG